jgi:pimeloyl-ACP methyl ester carboxylesterase
MLLLHGGWGGQSSANVWSANFAGLGECFRVIAPDRLGSGLTEASAGEDSDTVEAGVRHLHGVVDALELDGLHVVGQSTGGYFAARLALERPDQVRSLVIVDSATLAPDVGDYAARRDRTFEEPPADPREAVRHRYARMGPSVAHVTDELVDAQAYFESRPAAVAARERWDRVGKDRFMTSLRAQKVDTLQELADGRPAVPVLVSWARNDPTAILDQGLALFELIAEANPRSRMVIVNQAGHFHFREYADEFNRTVTAFVRTFTGGPR